MGTVFAIVVFSLVGVSGLIAVVALLFGGDPHSHVGRGGIEAPPEREDSSALRDEDVQQMLTAREARRQARGQSRSDMDDELSALLGSAAGPVDPEVEVEARAIVEARNARRRRRGQPVRDEDQEIAELLEELGGGPPAPRGPGGG